jgi:ABC-type multidrug transport system fused ATPase/permease subunit
MDRPHTANSYALATQDSWLEQATVKENILFGAPYNEKRLEEVLDACALKPDLARWTAGVDTEIGERGVSLSGGQRARVALARAVYSPAEILLLDDP